MSADAMARLRVAATLDETVDFGGVRVRLADLRALLDAHGEALDALEACIRPGADFIETFKRVEAVLAKAGRR